MEVIFFQLEFKSYHIYCFFFSFGLDLWALIGTIFTCSHCFCQYVTTMNSIECLHIIFLNDTVNDYDTFGTSLQMVILRHRAPKILFGRTNCSAAIDMWAVVYLLRWWRGSVCLKEVEVQRLNMIYCQEFFRCYTSLFIIFFGV